MVDVWVFIRSKATGIFGLCCVAATHLYMLFYSFHSLLTLLCLTIQCIFSFSLSLVYPLSLLLYKRTATTRSLTQASCPAHLNEPTTSHRRSLRHTHTKVYVQLEIITVDNITSPFMCCSFVTTKLDRRRSKCAAPVTRASEVKAQP